MKKNKKLWIILGLVLLVVIIGLALRKGDNAVRVETTKIEKRTITEIVSVTGKIQPESEVKISADVSGEITELAVKEGDSVKQGQLLLRINPEIYETTVGQLSANLSNGKAGLAASQAQRESVSAALLQAESNYKRVKKLWAEKVASEQEWEQARLQYETAKANLAAADKNILASQYSIQSLEASLDQGRKNLGRTSIYAPTSGIITNLNAEKGERVVGTGQMAGTEILRISNLNSMEVEVSVHENDISRVKIGDSCDIKVSASAYPKRIFKGMVTEVANSARFLLNTNNAENVTNYVVKIRILASSYADLLSAGKQPFKSDMTASVDIRTETRSNVLAVPIASVTTREPFKGDIQAKKDTKSDEKEGKEETKTWVFVYQNGTAKAIEVKTGIQDLNYFEVTEGLKPGDEVLSAPITGIAKDINDGDKVKKVEKGKIYDKKSD